MIKPNTTFQTFFFILSDFHHLEPHGVMSFYPFEQNKLR